MKIDIDKIEQIIRQAAKDTILPYYKCLEDCDIDTKQHENDFVTIADKKSEEFISNELKKIYPEAIIIGEESVAQNPQLLEELKDGRLSFIIDPVDGTRNFKEGVDDFGVMVGCGYKGETIAGFIYLPMYDKIAICEKGSGVYINGKRQQIIENTDVVPNMVGKVWGKAHGLEKYIKKASENRCAAVSYIEFVENKLNFICDMAHVAYPWDHMSGVLFTEEAGGYAQTVDGKDYDYREFKQTLIVADSKRNYDQLQKLAYEFFQKST